MTLIDKDGDRYACDTCIRGHRASKCEHPERWQIRIKKAGRPLSSCPHIKTKKSCQCHQEKVIVVMIPTNEQSGDCNCRVVRAYDPRIDGDDGRRPSQNPAQIQHPEDPARMIPLPNAQQPQLSQPSFNQGTFTVPAWQQHLANRGNDATPIGATNGQAIYHGPAWQHATQPPVFALDPSFRGFRGLPVQDAMRSPQRTLDPSLSGAQPNHHFSSHPAMHGPQPALDPRLSEAQPNHGLPFQDTVRTPQHAYHPSWNGLINQRTPPAMPVYPNQGFQVPGQEESHQITQAESPSTVQGDGSPQQILPNINGYSNFQSQPGQMNHTDLQPHFAPFDPSHPAVNGIQGQETRNVSSFLQQPNQPIQYDANFAPSMTMAQQPHYEQPIFHSPGFRGPNPLINFDMQPLELNDLRNSHYCPCGSGCDCTFCAAHPYNDATRARMQDLGHILAMENQPQLDGNYPTNGTNIDSVMGQEFHEEPLSFATFRSPNPLIADPALQPTIDEEGLVDNGNHSSEPPDPTMRNSDYYRLEYTVNSNNNEAHEASLYVNDCNCGCGRGPISQRHNGLPNA